jgi:hypothetical protein
MKGFAGKYFVFVILIMILSCSPSLPSSEPRWENVEHTCFKLEDVEHLCSSIQHVEHDCPDTIGYEPVWHSCDQYWKNISHMCNVYVAHWHYPSYPALPYEITDCGDASHKVPVMMINCGNSGSPHQELASDWTNSCGKSGVPHQVAYLTRITECGYAGTPHEESVAQTLNGCGLTGSPHQEMVPYVTDNCGQSGPPHQQIVDN